MKLWDVLKARAGIPVDDTMAMLFARRKSSTPVLYGYRINESESDPELRVEYLHDAVGMTPARMNYQTGQFDYGSWDPTKIWFLKNNRPVALKFDGTVDYELDPDDYTKKSDGTASDVSNANYNGNFMASMPAVWIKRYSETVSGTTYKYTLFSDQQLDSDFHADAHDAGDGFINDFIYFPLFKGYHSGNKLRSVSGVTPTGGTLIADTKAAAEACGSGWQLWDWSKHELISDLLTLISRSTNSQAAFGQGDSNTYDSSDPTTHGMLTTGTSGGGQFYGTNDETHHVKVFHIEDFWGNRFEYCLGLHLVNGYYVYKLARPYAVEPDATYTTTAYISPTNLGSPSGWQLANHSGRFGNLPQTLGGSGSTYYCDYYYGGGSVTTKTVFGGDCTTQTSNGSRYLYLRDGIASTGWDEGGSVCYSRPHSV